MYGLREASPYRDIPLAPIGPPRFGSAVKRIQSLLLPLLLGAVTAQAQPVRPFPAGFKLDPDSAWQRRVEGKLVPRTAGVFVGNYSGWSNCIELQATNKAADAIIVPAIGGRVLHFSIGGESILFEPPEGAGKSLATARPGFPVGGYQVDIGPESLVLPEHPQLWQGRHTWTSPADWHVQVTSGKDPKTGLEIRKSIRLDPETGALHLMQWVDNKAPADITLCLRDRTLCQGGGFVFFPLNPKSRFPAGWSLRRKAGDRVTYDGATPFSPKVRVIDGVLIAKTEGESQRLGADSDAGWIAYARGRLLFVKFFNWYADGAYRDSGNSVETSWDGTSVELETRSPETRLRRYNPYGFAGRWRLLPLEEPATTFDQVRALAARVIALRNSSGKLEMARIDD